MTNLFAWRDTDKEAMKRVSQPIGEKGNYFSASGREFTEANDLELWTAQLHAPVTVAAWGNDGGHLYRAARVKMLLPALMCLRITKKGFPEHPLYLPGNLKPIQYT